MATGNEILFKIAADSSELLSELNKANSTIKKLQQQTESSSKGMFKSFIDIKAATEMVVDVFSRIIDTGKEFFKIAGEMDSVRIAFKGMAAGMGIDGDELIKSMSDAVKGTVDEIDLMKMASKAMMQSGVEVIEKLPELSQIALAVARTQGKQIGETLETLLSVTGRESEKKLMQLGLSAKDARQEMIKFADSLGKDVDELTDAQHQQGFFNAVLSQGNKIIGDVDLSIMTLGETMQALKVQTDENKESFINGMTPALKSFADGMIKSKESMNIFKQMGETIGEFLIWIRDHSFIFNMLYPDGRKAKAEYLELASGMQSIKDQLDDIENDEKANGINETNRTKAQQEKINGLTMLMKYYGSEVANAEKKMKSLGQTTEEIQLFEKDIVSAGAKKPEMKTTPKEKGDDVAKKKIDMIDYYNFLGLLRDADLAKEKKSLDDIMSKRGIDKDMRIALKEAASQKEQEIDLRYQMELATYTGNFQAAEMIKLELDYQTKMKMYQDDADTKMAIDEAYNNQRVIASYKADEQERQSKEQLMRAKLGMESQGWNGAAMIANMGQSLMQSKNKKIFMVGQALAISNAFISAAEAIMKGFSYGPFVGIPYAILVGIATGIQVARIKAQKPPSYATGYMPDMSSPLGEHLAYVSNNEAIMKEKATRNNADLLRYMNANPEKSVVAGGNGFKDLYLNLTAYFGTDKIAKALYKMSANGELLLHERGIVSR